MYSTKKIPEPFQGKPKKEASVPLAAPVETKEKQYEPTPTKQNSTSPLLAFLLLDLFSAQKKDG